MIQIRASLLQHPRIGPAGHHPWGTPRSSRLAMARQALTCVLLLAAAASVRAQGMPEADAAFHSGRYAVALAQYERLAARGDAAAAERAAHMLLLGESLYGTAVVRDSARAVTYLQQAAKAGSASGALLLQRLDVTPSAQASDHPGPYGC
jgi:TPR repeat protein